MFTCFTAFHAIFMYVRCSEVDSDSGSGNVASFRVVPCGLNENKNIKKSHIFFNAVFGGGILDSTARDM